MMLGLGAVLEKLAAQENLKAIVLSGEGPHFSFGASIEETFARPHQRYANAFANLLLKMAAAPAPTIAAVRGQCLDGEFELDSCLLQPIPPLTVAVS